jgi:hypothetical protein
MPKLTIDEIIGIANEAYPDSLIEQNFNKDTKKATCGCKGDGLANFIVRELVDTFDPSAPRKKQLTEAARVMRTAIRELESVAARFEGAK